MKPQLEKTVEKNIDSDDEFDFFKQNQSSAPKTNPEPIVQLEKQETVKQNPKSTQNVTAAFIFLCSIVIFVIGTSTLMMVDKNNEAEVYTVKSQSKTVTVKPTTVIAEQTNNPEQPFNVDYSKLSKEDTERVKYALDQFSDIQKTLIETNKPVGKP